MTLNSDLFGELQSPGYATGQLYPNQDCSWTIETPANQSFTLIVDSDFELEDNVDYLQVEIGVAC